MLMRCIRAENRKLRRSPIWLLFLAVPAISAIYGTFNYRMNQGILTHGWYDLWTQYTLFYALFFFAPLIGVYAAYLWRLEHRGHNWNLIMTAPGAPLRSVRRQVLRHGKNGVSDSGLASRTVPRRRKAGRRAGGVPAPGNSALASSGCSRWPAHIAIQLLLSMVIRNFACRC